MNKEDVKNYLNLAYKNYCEKLIGEFDNQTYITLINYVTEYVFEKYDLSNMSISSYMANEDGVDYYNINFIENNGSLVIQFCFYPQFTDNKLSRNVVRLVVKNIKNEYLDEDLIINNQYMNSALPKAPFDIWERIYENNLIKEEHNMCLNLK